MSKETRAALRAAAEKVSALRKQIQALEVAEERAEGTADQARQELARHAHLDKEITKWRVEQVKKGASTKTLPNQLQTKVAARRDASEELEQSQSTLQAIREELEGLNFQCEKAEAEARTCAVTVLHEMGDALAAELRSINMRRRELRQLLSGLSDVKIERPGYAPKAIGISRAAEEALNMDGSFDFPGNIDPAEEIVRRWARRLEALCADPNAEITAPKHLTPSDYVPGKPREFVGAGLPWSPGTPGSWKSE